MITALLLAFPVLGPTPRTAAQTPGLVAAYSFDEGSGPTAADASGNGNTGSLVGGPQWVPGRYGSALSFNGASTYVTLARTDAFDALATGTIEMWMRWDGGGGFGGLLSADSGSCQHPFELAIQGGTFEVWAAASGCTGSFNALTALPAPATAWHHVAYVVSGTGNRLYVDGVEAAASYAAGSSSTRFFFSSAAAGTTRYDIGRTVDNPAETFDGAIDELRIYSTALTATEIERDMNTPIGGSAPPPPPPTPPPPPPPGIPLSIDAGQQFQVMQGFGVNANSASWNNGELRPAIDMLVDQAGATIWRVIIDNADWEAVNDNGNPGTFNWTYYNGIYTSAKLEELWGTMGYLNQKGIESGLMLNIMGPPASWMGGDARIGAAFEDEWVEMIASLVYYARSARGLRFTLLAPMNEPEWDGIEGPMVDRVQYVRLLRKLAQKFDALGLSDIRLVGPDRAGGVSGFDSFFDEMLTDPVVMSKLEHWSIHEYSGDSAGAAAMIAASAYPGKDFWITEVTNIWDALGHLQHGPTAVLAWDGYDSVYNHAILAGRGTTPPNDVGNGPPLIAYSTSTRLYTPRKAFYEHAQLYRFIDRGARRIAAVEANGNLVVYAFHQPTTNRLTVVGRHAGSGSLTITGSLANLTPPGALQFYLTDGSNNLARRPDVPVSGGSFTFTVSGGSVFTLTSAAASGPDITPPTVPQNLQATAVSASRVDLSWSAATDNVGVTGYRVFRDGVQIASPTGVSLADSGLQPGTAYSYQVAAVDAAGNISARSAAATVTTLRADGTAPAVAIISPGEGSVIAGTVTLQAQASDPGPPGEEVSGVARVWFLADGLDLGLEDFTAPYTAVWDTTATGNGAHDLVALARDGAGHTAISGAVRVTVNNPTPDTSPPSIPTGLNAAALSDSQIALSWNPATDNVGVTGYRVFRDGAVVANVSATSYTDGGLLPSTTYQYQVRARDAAGNESGPSAAVSATTQAPPASPGLVAYYAFEEASGQAVFDGSGNGLGGVLGATAVAESQDPTRTTSGKYGKALSFDGTNDYVTVNDAASLDLTTGMTIEAWVYPTTTTDWRTVALKEHQNGLSYALYANEPARGPSGWVRIAADQDAASASRLPANVWSHLAVTYDGQRLRLYVNGAAAATRDQTGAISTSSSPLRIGGNSVWGEHFQGRIDELRIYRQALAPAQIQSDMNAAHP